MLTIRLTRKGKKNQPFFRIVVIDKRRSAKGGRAVEELGYVNPLTKKNSVNKERALYWLGVGAKATPRIHNLFVSEKVIDEAKINTFKITKKAKAAAVEATKAAAAAAAAPKAEEVSASPADSAAPADQSDPSRTPTEVGEEVKPEPVPEAPAPETPKEEEKTA